MLSRATSSRPLDSNSRGRVSPFVDGALTRFAAYSNVQRRHGYPLAGMPVVVPAASRDGAEI